MITSRELTVSYPIRIPALPLSLTRVRGDSAFAFHRITVTRFLPGFAPSHPQPPRSPAQSSRLPIECRNEYRSSFASTLESVINLVLFWRRRSFLLSGQSCLSQSTDGLQTRVLHAIQSRTDIRNRRLFCGQIQYPETQPAITPNESPSLLLLRSLCAPFPFSIVFAPFVIRR